MSGFKTKARAIDLLGEKQIADEATAISELFKNSHDADAEQAVLSIDTKANSLILWDDGHGMHYDEVLEKWLTIGTDSKLGSKEEPVRYTESGRRITMGEKGIGRLAIAVLGHQMLMLSKRVGSNWTVTYIHWGIFENGRIFLEDTIVPVGELADIRALPQQLPSLKDELRTNLTRTDKRVREAWSEYADLKERILSDITAFNVEHFDLQRAISKIEAKGHGTLFYVSSLKENWAALAAPDRRVQSIRRKMDELEMLMASFINTIALFEGKAYESYIEDHFNFAPSVEIDGQPVVNPEGFSSEDLSRFDYALSGEIIAGQFRGTVMVKDRESHQVAVPVDNGIDAFDYFDCGPFRIRLFFVEGDADKSFLDPGVHSEIIRKLKRIGGVYLYRDGLRVLPYGRTDFDFLDLETRGSKDLGGFPLRNRRLFGYIAISKRSNPALQDKSSREGLRQNREYAFFLTLLRNLTEWWAKDFIVPRRDSIVQAVETKRKAAKEEEQLRRQRENELNEFVNSLKGSVTKAKDLFSQTEADFRSRFVRILPSVTELSSLISYRQGSGDWTYFTALSLLQAVDDAKAQCLKELSKLGTLDSRVLNQRFAEESLVKDVLNAYEEWVDHRRKKLRNEISERAESARVFLDSQLGIYLQALSTQLNLKTADGFVRSLQDLVADAERSVNIARNAAAESLQLQLEKRAFGYRKVVDGLNGQLADLKSQIERRFSQSVQSQFERPAVLANELHNLFDQFGNLAPEQNLSAIVSSIQAKVFALSECLTQAKNEADLQIQRAADELRFPALEIFGYQGNVQDDWRLIGHLSDQLRDLSAQMEGYRQLVSTGLAAEVVNHEFEQQYHLLRRLFERPTIQDLKASNKDLRNIEYLFKHLEERHRLLSPLYRRTRMYRKEISLGDVGEQMRNFFASPLGLYHIDFDNQIEPEFVIKESESILYPAFINVINNSLYWLLKSTNRRILLHSDLKNRMIFMEDSGPGIEPTRAEKVFELFYSTRPDGRGIGLHLVRELLSSRNHRVSVLTESRGKRLTGACFCIEFSEEAVVKEGN